MHGKYCFCLSSYSCFFAAAAAVFALVSSLSRSLTPSLTSLMAVEMTMAEGLSSGEKYFFFLSLSLAPCASVELNVARAERREEAEEASEAGNRSKYSS